MGTIACSQCDAAIPVEEGQQGQRVACPSCGQSVAVPSPVTAAPPGIDSVERDLDSWVPRRRPRYDPEYAKQAVMAPAAALQATGVIGGALTLIAGCASALGMLASILDYDWRFGRWLEDGGFLFFLGFLHVLASIAGAILAYLGGRRMARLEGYALVVMSCFVLMVPILSPCWVIGIPVGVWALVVLNKDEVKAAFR